MAQVSSTIADLPNELLHQVLHHVHTSLARKDFISALAVCRRWNAVGNPFLWRDITITNKSIDHFAKCLAIANDSTLAVVRSLNLDLHMVWEVNQYPDDMENRYFDVLLLQQQGKMPDWVNPSMRSNIEWWRLLESISDVSESMNKLSNLSTFAFKVDERNPQVALEVFKFVTNINYATLPNSLLGDLLRSLPPSCRILDFDTAGLDDCAGGKEHLCIVLRKALPQLEHVNLRLRRVCPNLVEHDFGGLAHAGSAFTSPLKTLNINLDNGIGGMRKTSMCGLVQRFSPAHPDYLDFHDPWLSGDMDDTEPQTSSSQFEAKMQEALQKMTLTGLFPQAKCFTLSGTDSCEATKRQDSFNLTKLPS